MGHEGVPTPHARSFRLALGGPLGRLRSSPHCARGHVGPSMPTTDPKRDGIPGGVFYAPQAGRGCDDGVADGGPPAFAPDDCAGVGNCGEGWGIVFLLKVGMGGGELLPQPIWNAGDR